MYCALELEGVPTFQDPGTPYYGLAGTRVLASLIELVLRSPKRVPLSGLGLANPTKTREYPGSRVPLNSSTVHTYFLIFIAGALYLS